MTFWQDKPVLITGASGLLGSALVKDLLKNKADVVCLLRDWVPDSEIFRNENVNDVTIVSGAITNQSLIERTLGEYEIETVFHLAAQTIVKVANNNPVSTFESNIKGTWTVLEACRRSPAVTSIVVASSDKAYGTQPILPYTEDMPLKGIYPYDVSKVCTDLVAQSYAQTYQLPLGITRCGNFYGPGDLNWNRIIPGTIRSILRNLQPVIRSDGNSIRDYLFIDDAAKGYLRLAEYLEKVTTLNGEAFNLSSETPISTIKLVNYILELMGSDLEPIILNRAENEIKEQWLSAEKAHRLLNWYPLYYLDDGLRTTINWYKEILK